MAHAERTVTIGRPIGEVFDFLADGTNNPKWRHAVLDVTLTAGEGATATYAQGVRGPGGRRLAGDYRVVGFDPPHRLAVEVTSGPVRPSIGFELHELAATSTSVRCTVDLRPRGLLARLADGAVRRGMEEEVAHLEDLKRYLEEAAP
ncbi:MAG TPA: SRPBCC family protein [Acidimicrobiales bacterium]|nr:SRPBCC family protein [Acidimicrobiales bacterium]